MFAVCARCKKPVSLEKPPESEYVCEACVGVPAAPPESAPKADPPWSRLRERSSELWETRRRDGIASTSLFAVVALALFWLFLLSPGGSGRPAQAIALSMMVFGCFGVYTLAIWHVTKRSVEEYVHVWKCAVLALILCAMELVTIYVIGSGARPSCGAFGAAAAGGWFIYSMFFRAFFRVPLAIAMGITLISASLAFLGTVLFLCTGGTMLSALAS